MQLKYLKGKFINVYGGADMRAYPLSPVGEVPDSIAKALLKRFPDLYAVNVPEAPKQEIETVAEVVPEVKTTFKCEQCDYEATSNAGLSAHKRFKHKENN